jgi:hypothetical protein
VKTRSYKVLKPHTLTNANKRLRISTLLGMTCQSPPAAQQRGSYAAKRNGIHNGSTGRAICSQTSYPQAVDGPQCMTTLLVGFDSAWPLTNSGALVGILRLGDGKFHEIGLPQIVNYQEAEQFILKWQAEHLPTATIVSLDQPTIVKIAVGQRPVENIVGSPVGLRYGGMQPANTGRDEMFGEQAPVWRFLTRFSVLPPLIGRIVTITLRRILPVRRGLAAGCAILGSCGCNAGSVVAEFHDDASAKPRGADWRPEARAPKPNFFR